MKAIYCWKYLDAPMSLSHARMWAGSVFYARRAGMTPVLVADQTGIDFLVSGMGLPFEEVIPMPELPDELVHIYDLQKLSALLSITGRGEAAFHIDHDVFLRRPLPDRVLTAPCAGEFFYESSKAAQALHDTLPVQRFAGALPRGLAGGITGGTDHARIAQVCRESLSVALDPRNREVLQSANGNLASTLFGELSFGDAFPDAAVLLPQGMVSQIDYYRAGYIHAAGALKSNAGSRMEMLEFFRTEFPVEFAATLPSWDAYFTR